MRQELTEQEFDSPVERRVDVVKMWLMKKYHENWFVNERKGLKGIFSLTWRLKTESALGRYETNVCAQRLWDVAFRRRVHGRYTPFTTKSSKSSTRTNFRVVASCAVPGTYKLFVAWTFINRVLWEDLSQAELLQTAIVGQILQLRYAFRYLGRF